MRWICPMHFLAELLLLATVINITVSLEKSMNFIRNFYATVSCPCEKAEWCNPITNVTRNEVYAFSLVNDENHWQKYDWTKVTTICMYGYLNTKLMCLAHSHNARAVVLGAVDKTIITTPSLRTQWIDNQLKIVKENFLDGINFDYEGTITKHQEALRQAYIDLVNETSTAFKRELPYSQVSVDVVFTPYCGSYDYGYSKLAEVSDFLFIMAYDEKNAVSGPYIAGPNSDYTATKEGLEGFLHDRALSIPNRKLVLGLPWYGKIYECVQLVQEKCLLNIANSRIDHLGIFGNTGDYIVYDAIFKLLLTMPENYRWNSTSATPFFSFKNSTTDKIYQIQYDDPSSLLLKYKMAGDLNIRGVGIWTIDYLDYSDTIVGQEIRKSMFETLP